MDHSGNLSQRKVVSASFAIFHKYVILLQSTTRPLEMEVSPQTLDYQSPYNNRDHRIPGIIEYLGSSNSFGWLHVVPTWWLNCPLSNRIEKLVSQWSPVLPKWWNLVQFDFQQKHPDPAKDTPLHRRSSAKCAHRGWLCIAQGVVIHQSYNRAENIGKHLRTSEKIYEEDFKTRTKIWDGW